MAARNMPRLFQVAGALFLAVAPVAAAAPASTRIYEDGAYFVYRETQSCALYADFPEDTMLRVSYQPKINTVFLSVVGAPWAESRLGSHPQVHLVMKDDPQVRYAFVGTIFKQPSADDDRKGVSINADRSFLDRLATGGGLAVQDMELRPIAQMSLPKIEGPLKRMLDCSVKHFGPVRTAPPRPAASRRRPASGPS